MKRKPKHHADNGFEEGGGYMAVKITKLEEQFSAFQAVCPQVSKIFDGVSIFVNGHTNPSSEELKRIMMQHGGIFHHYHRSHTKFIIASVLPDVKVRSNITRNIVRPEWIVDSLKESRLLDYSKYLLHTNKNRTQPKIAFKDPAPAKEESLETDPFALSLNALNAKLNQTSENSVKEEVKTGTAVDLNFLEEFLNNSRLHHIATLGSGFKFHINDLRKNHDGKFPHREELQAKLKRCETIPESKEIVMHIDMDCFFVNVSLKNHPELKGLPVAVTHSKGKNDNNDDFSSYSEIASCSYEARAKGLKNGMFVGAALKLCPELKTIPYDFEDYKRTAYTLYDTIAKYTLEIEAVSCDELYADLKSLLVESRVDVIDFVSMLRKDIFESTGCTCSVGLGGNRLQARMATKEAKPNGQYSLLSEDVEFYMSDKKIRDLPGVGPNTAHQLAQLKLEFCGQLQKLPVQLLQQTFGKKFGETLQMMSKGLDDKKLVFEQVRKSVSVEVNYGIRFNEDHEVHFFLKQVSDELSKRLKEINKKGKLLTLKLMVRAKDASVETVKFMGHGVAEKISKSVSLLASTDDSIMIHNNVLKLLAAFNIPPYELRGIGVQMSKLDEERKDSELLKMFKKVAEKQSSSETARVKPQEETRVQILDSSPKKTSPTKKRGRPTKLSAIRKTNVPSVSDIFNSKKNSKIYHKRTVEMIDPEVLAELPPDIVEEILKEYQMPDETSDSTIKIDKDSVESFNQTLNESTCDNIFLELNWRSVIMNCIDEGENIEFIQEKLQHDAAQLVRVRNLDRIYLAMRFLHRIISDRDDCIWHTIYNSIAADVQAEMLTSFKKKLSVPKDF